MFHFCRVAGVIAATLLSTGIASAMPASDVFTVQGCGASAGMQSDTFMDVFGNHVLQPSVGPMVMIAYTNASNKPVKAVEFGVVNNGKLVAVVRDHAMAGHEQRPRIGAQRRPDGAADSRRLAEGAGDLAVAAGVAGFDRQRGAVDLPREFGDLREVEIQIGEILQFAGEVPAHARDDRLDPGRDGFVCRGRRRGLVGQPKSGQAGLVPEDDTRTEGGFESKRGHACLRVCILSNHPLLSKRIPMENRFYNAFDAETFGGARKPDYRNAFQTDRDRIIHAHAFRKLQSKTQVFLSGEYDFYRTRLTHSIEVSQIGRSICHFLRTQGGPLRADFQIDSPIAQRR